MRVLIAEPDAKECRSARLLLSHAGHRIVAATTSAAAAAMLARQANPDLCVVEAGFAGADGAEVAETIWLESGAPCLLIGGAPEAALGPPALGRLARPFGALELLEAVEICRTLLRHEAPPTRLDRFKRLTLYPAAPPAA